MKRLQDTSKDGQSTLSEEKAVNLLRQKIANMYSHEPDANEESQEAERAGKHRSKHQEYMHNLSASGKSLAEIQTEWHNYYLNLPDNEKHEVWKEFYSEHSRIQKKNTQKATNKTEPKESGHTYKLPEKPVRPLVKDRRSVGEIKSQLLKKARQKPNKSQNLKSLVFGLGFGSLIIFLFLFGFFNERFIAPFISPSKSVSNTPIIIDPSTSTVGPEPKIIIPKINVEIPVVYDQPSVAEDDIQSSLEEGVVHYATTPLPGEKGNGVIFGHSSNNILNKGKYKFAFVLLKQLEVGDTFYLHKDGVRYVYKVGSKTVVKPTDVSVLTTSTDKSTITLITCDPPGTSLNRLLVSGEQISPDPAANIASSAKPSQSEQVSVIPSNAPSLWQRITNIF